MSMLEKLLSLTEKDIENLATDLANDMEKRLDDLNEFYKSDRFKEIEAALVEYLKDHPYITDYDCVEDYLFGDVKTNEFCKWVHCVFTFVEGEMFCDPKCDFPTECMKYKNIVVKKMHGQGTIFSAANNEGPPGTL